MFRILIAEDDNNIANLMKTCLIKAGFEVYVAENGVRALEIMDQVHIDLTITDIMMPHMDGIQLTKHLRKISDIPIMIVTAKESFEDKKVGFDMGADDYLTKPFDLDEMVIRVNALLRRSKLAGEKIITIGQTNVDYNNLSVSGPQGNVELTKKEFQLLFKLLSTPNRIFTRTQLMDDIWGYDSESDERTVDVHVRRIREKLESVTDFEVVTVRGLGYKAVKKA